MSALKKKQGPKRVQEMINLDEWKTNMGRTNLRPRPPEVVNLTRTLPQEKRKSTHREVPTFRLVITKGVTLHPSPILWLPFRSNKAQVSPTAPLSVTGTSKLGTLGYFPGTLGQEHFPEQPYLAASGQKD